MNAVKLTPEILARYVGGWLEVQNSNLKSGYLHRGEILTAKLKGVELEITLAWNAKGVGFPPQLPTSWVYIDQLTFGLCIDVCDLFDIGPGSEGGDIRICIDSHTVREVVTLYPANGHLFDRSKIRVADQTPA